ncbi:FliH/SctL family protein [Paenibacillus eucommiae]|uniref:Flagellar assembly protein FliH n=1 Tax=Paenibacillus eucommiae TaxID=1355755 RepID=A0ABS4IUT0_9BACL|nr:FliH/SctL family protein [Paenibacillus eucommiae]MBP1991339.1 flagellar assembly protein FliH [Paenibacillus eucommiae]
MSSVIKSSGYISLDDIKVIESLTHSQPLESNSIEPNHNPIMHAYTPEQQQELQDANVLKEQILRDAEAFADQQVQMTLQECAALKEQTDTDINEWWQTRRNQDEQASQLARQTGYDDGYKEGLQRAEAELKRQYDEMLSEARTILEQSYTLKQQIIQESEPFLIELSTSIAEKILARQLNLSPEWVVELIQQVLSRRREKGTIALCVAPEHFAYIQDAREELLTSIDSQAELEIIPDSTVHDHGCVIRSSFGSIDARIDTQLKEIKAALQQLAMTSEGAE